MLAELDQVSRTIGLVLGCRHVTADQRLVEDLGAESADILNIMVTLEQKYGVKIDETEMTAVATVRDLYHLLMRMTHAATPGSDPPRST
jgi:acyl carrier protein